MNSLLNSKRPPVFCPGCSHERISHSLDTTFQNLGLAANNIVMVSDIGCSGLFDTFFNTHAFHGLHGRALTYATGLKLAQPELTVVVTMGDGGQGIGGAHLLSACRRNLDLTLLVLNNFNFGMTGGQFSATTPPEAVVGSGFLNRLEFPLDISQVAKSAGASYVSRCSAYRKDLPQLIGEAIQHKGFSVMDIWGVCPGRYTKKNRLTPNSIEKILSEQEPMPGVVTENNRGEYGEHYRRLAAEQKAPAPLLRVEAQFDPPEGGRQEVVLLGGAGQRIITAGEILCLAGLSGGLNTTQKNEYNITVLRGPSISELILSPSKIDYTGISRPTVVVALGQEGVDRRKDMFGRLGPEALVLQIEGIRVPQTRADIHKIDFKSQGVRKPDWALAALIVLGKLGRVVRPEMLESALTARFDGKILQAALELVARVSPQGRP